MKILIASDIHGSAYYCQKLMQAFEREQAERLLLLGDILYHGPRNALPRDYNPMEVAQQLNVMKEKVFCVKGNCDTEVDQMVLEFPIMAEYCLLNAGERLIFATHGHNYNLQSLPQIQPGDILLHGHTHVPAWQSFGQNNIYLNPGSVSIPKENSDNGYMLLNSSEMLWKTLDGELFHSEIL